MFDPLASNKGDNNFKSVISEHTFRIKFMLVRRMPLNKCDDKSTLIQVMAWEGQAPNSYPSLCGTGSISAVGLTRPQWVRRILSIVNRSLRISFNWKKTHLKMPPITSTYVCSRENNQTPDPTNPHNMFKTIHSLTFNPNTAQWQISASLFLPFCGQMGLVNPGG